MNKKQTESARGEPCTMRLDMCKGGAMNETVVFAHKNGAGMGQKSVDEDGNEVGFMPVITATQSMMDRHHTHIIRRLF